MEFIAFLCVVLNHFLNYSSCQLRYRLSREFEILQNVSNVVEKKNYLQSNYFYPYFSWVKLNEVNNKSLHHPGKPVYT